MGWTKSEQPHTSGMLPAKTVLEMAIYKAIERTGLGLVRRNAEGAESSGGLGGLWFFSSCTVFHVQGDLYLQQFTDTGTDIQQRVEKEGNIT